MKAYASSGPLSMSGAPKTFIALINTASRRAKLLQVVIGPVAATLTDISAQWAIRKITTDGSGTTGAGALAAMQADSADGAPAIVVKNNYSAEPTYANGSIDIPLHERNTYIWTPPTSDTIVACPLGTSNGLGIVLVSGPTGVLFDVTTVWDE